jgi:hypothetical protein
MKTDFGLAQRILNALLKLARANSLITPEYFVLTELCIEILGNAQTGSATAASTAPSHSPVNMVQPADVESIVVEAKKWIAGEYWSQISKTVGRALSPAMKVCSILHTAYSLPISIFVSLPSTSRRNLSFFVQSRRCLWLASFSLHVVPNLLSLP